MTARTRPATRRLAAALVAVGLAMTACSTTSSTSTSSSSGGTAKAPAAVTAQLAAAAKVPALVSPGGKLDISAARGKTIFVIPLFSNNQYNQLIDTAMKQAGALTGTTVRVFENQGQVNQWVSGMNQAISQKVGVIVLGGGIDPRLLLPQIADARSHGIKVVSSQFFDNDVSVGTSCGSTLTLTCTTGVDAVVPAPYRDSARIDADWIIADSGAAAHTLVLTSNDVGPNAYQVAEIKKEFAAQCPKCTQTYVNIPSSQWATNTQSEVQSSLGKDPSIDYVLPVYDVMAAESATAIGVAGRAGKVRISTFNGTPAVLGLIGKSGAVGVDVGQNLAQIGYATMDQALRLLTGTAPSTTERDAIRAFDTGNVGDTGNPPKANGGFGSGYLDAYKTLWGVR